MAAMRTEMDIIIRLRKETSPLMHDAAREIERLRTVIEDAVETLEAMDLHIDNPLYERLRAAVEQ